MQENRGDPGCQTWACILHPPGQREQLKVFKSRRDGTGTVPTTAMSVHTRRKPGVSLYGREWTALGKPERPAGQRSGVWRGDGRAGRTGRNKSLLERTARPVDCSRHRMQNPGDLAGPSLEVGAHPLASTACGLGAPAWALQWWGAHPSERQNILR